MAGTQDRADARGADDDAARRLALVDHAERVGGLGSWQWTPRTGEVVWSANLFRLFGFEPGAIVPSADWLLERVHSEDRQRVVEMFAALPAGEPLENEHRIIRADGALRFFRVTVALVEREGGATRIVGSVRDVTVQRGLERENAARLAATEALDAWESFDPGARDLLGRVGEAMGFALGTFWVPEGDELGARAIWHGSSPELDRLAEMTRAWRPGTASPVLGRAYMAREPVLSGDLRVGRPPALVAALGDAGIRTIVGVPAVHGDETLAVLGFLAGEPVDPRDRLVRALHGMGHEIGLFLSHRRGELGMATLSPRETQVLQLAARGHSMEEIGRELYVSRATVKRHFERAYAHLDVSDRAAAVGEAMRRGLIS